MYDGQLLVKLRKEQKEDYQVLCSKSNYTMSDRIRTLIEQDILWLNSILRIKERAKDENN